MALLASNLRPTPLRLAALTAVVIALSCVAASALADPQDVEGEAQAEGDTSTDDTADAEPVTDDPATTNVAGPSSTESAPVAEGTPSPSMSPTQLALVLPRGERVYRRFCATCHGRRGDGRGPAARFLDPTPRDFTTGLYKWRATMSGALPSDADILRTIRRGAPGTAMPAWQGRLPRREIEAVAQFIKTFSSRFDSEVIPPPMHIPRFPPEFDAEAVTRGRALYVLMRCWTCHGVDGTGGGDAAETLTDDAGNPIEAYDFSQGRFRSGGSPRDIFRTFTTGVNGTPMPSFNDALLVGRDAFTDLTSYREVVSAAEVREMERFVARLPTSEEIWSVSEEERETWSAQLRWDLVAYVMSLSRLGFTGYLATDPYATD